MTRKVKRKNRTKKIRGGKNNKNCKTKCKATFAKIIKKDKRFKTLKKLSSILGSKKNIDDELNKALDSKKIQNDPVFKNCVSECNKK